GVLAMPGDESAFCDAASWLLEEPETLRRVRLNARQHASRQGWAAVIEQFEDRLRSACEHGPDEDYEGLIEATVKPRSAVETLGT
ncbi:glycosyltransferase family 1 protein, partial [Pseudomonas sp. SIMBA_041]